MDSEGNVRYVTAGNPTGWAAMAKTVRDVDEDKVKDYKEDIDTLLVFTGLFSAVLTAFVIESYRSLSTDPQMTIINLLERLVNQTSGYTIAAGSANSTFVITATTPSDPTPTLAALRVNQLWFSSLVVTLVTASFAMLVKQWLREYLSVDYTSPREQLRARQFRHPGLAAWKVYEIAGFLPLLLQLALGLFFLGLCFFTWSIDHSVGKTSSVLVTGWAFLLLTATLAPLTSPRCPYKTAFLKNIMVIIRRRIRSIVLPSPVLTGVRAVLRPIAVPSGACSAFLPAGYLVEEIEAVKQDFDELAILKHVDSFLLDDELLGTTISESLILHNAPPPITIDFVLQVLNHRLSENHFTDTQSLTALPDLRQLTKRGWGTASDIVANTVQRGLEKLSNPHASKQWLEGAIRLMLSLSDHPLTTGARNALIRCIHRDSMPHFVRVIDSLRSETRDVQRHVVSRLCDLCVSVPSSNAPAEDAIALVLCLYGFELQVNIQQQNHFLLYLDSLSEDTWRTGSTTLGNIILRNLQTQPGVDSIGTWLEDAWSIVLSRSRFSIPNDVLKALERCVIEETASRFGDLVSRHIFSRDPLTAHINSTMASLCKKLTTTQEVGSAPHIISFCVHAFAKGQSAYFIEETSVSSSLSHILDLRGLDTDLWLAAVQCVAGSLSEVLEKHVATDAVKIGSLYEDALYMLLSLSDSLAIPCSTSCVMMLGIEIDEDTSLRLAQFIRSLEAPTSEHFPFVLSHLHRILAVDGERARSGQVVQFLYHSLGHSLQDDLLADPTASAVLDLRNVPLETWQFFIDIVANVLQDELRKSAAAGPGLVIPWFKQALSLLVSISEGSVSPAVCDVLIACLQGDSTQRTQLLQSVRALVPTDNIMLSAYVERLSAICKTLLSHPTATPDISSLVFAALNLDIPPASASVLPKSFIDVKNLSRSAWTFLSETLADILMTGLDVQGGSTKSVWVLGSWSASVVCALLAISQHPIPPKAQDALIAYIQADDKLKTHFWQLIQSKTLTQNHLTHVMRRILSLCGPLASRTDGPTNVIRLLLHVLQNFTHTSLSSPLKALIDLRSLPQESWDLLNETILETVLLPIKDLKSETPGPWMEDACHIVFSLSPYPLSPTVTEMVSRLCSDDYPYHRFGRFLRRHIRPASPHFLHGLARAHAIALCFADRYADLNWFLREVLSSVPCTSYCTHSSNTPFLSSTFHSHAGVDDEWTRRYVLILVDLIKNVNTEPGPWPAGAAESFRALLSCPTPLRALSPEAAEIVFKIICWKSAIGGALSGIMSAATEKRAMVNNAAAIRTVTSLVVGANSHGRMQFFDAMWDHCDNYMFPHIVSQNQTVAQLNVVRQCAFVTQVYSEVQSDANLRMILRKFYSCSMDSLKRFREVQFPGMTDRTEISNTRTKAEQCLVNLDNLEPMAAAFEDWAADFKTESSLLPDGLFQELAAFVPEDTALRFKRVKLLRRRGVERILIPAEPRTEAQGRSDLEEDTTEFSEWTGNHEAESSFLPDDLRQALAAYAAQPNVQIRVGKGSSGRMKDVEDKFAGSEEWDPTAEGESHLPEDLRKAMAALANRPGIGIRVRRVVRSKRAEKETVPTTESSPDSAMSGGDASMEAVTANAQDGPSNTTSESGSSTPDSLWEEVAPVEHVTPPSGTDGTSTTAPEAIGDSVGGLETQNTMGDATDDQTSNRSMVLWKGKGRAM